MNKPTFILNLIIFSVFNIAFIISLNTDLINKIIISLWFSSILIAVIGFIKIKNKENNNP